MPIRVGALLVFLSWSGWAGEVAAAGKAKPAYGTLDQWQSTLPSWLDLSGELRGRLDGYFGLSGIPGRDNAYYLHRLRLNGTISLARWMRLIAQVQDSREVGYDRTQVPYTVADPLDLRQGYIELGLKGDEAPWAVRAGRQPLWFGDNRLVATSNWGNVGPSYDAVRVTLRHTGLRLDGFSGWVVVPTDGFDRFRKNKRLSGIYGSYDLKPQRSTVDAYGFWSQTAVSQVGTYGLRSAGRLGRGFDFDVEVAWQRGSRMGEPVAAWAGHWELGRTWNQPGGAFRLAAEYNYATGDRPRDGQYESFDSLYPTNIYATAADFGWRNTREPVLTAEWRPAKNWKIKTAYHLFWLAERQDALYSFSGAVFAFQPDATDSRVGSEFDARIVRQVNKNLQFWVGYAHLFPGPYLKQAGKGAIDYPYGMWTCSF